MALRRGTEAPVIRQTSPAERRKAWERQLALVAGLTLFVDGKPFQGSRRSIPGVVDGNVDPLLLSEEWDISGTLAHGVVGPEGTVLPDGTDVLLSRREGDKYEGLIEGRPLTDPKSIAWVKTTANEYRRLIIDPPPPPGVHEWMYA